MLNPCYRQKSNYANQQMGLTLIEFMIAMAIGVFLIAGILQLFFSARQSYQVQDALSRLQENGRFAMKFIGEDIRMAGFRQCYSREKVDDAIGGVNGVETTNPDSSDTLTLKWLAANCDGTYPPGYTQDAQNRNYSIVATGPYLMRNGTEQLVSGIENMQILYGVDTDANGSPNYYAPASTAIMIQVVTIRVSLLTSSEDNIVAQPMTFTFNGETKTATDRKLRQIYTSTFAVRNRLI